MSNILITGGSGFLGSHLCKALVDDHNVFIVDPNISSIPKTKHVSTGFLGNGILDNIDIVIHLASRNGIELSMESPSNSLEVNVLNTSVLFEEIRKSKVKKVILTSSTTVYGEGLYYCPNCENDVSPVRDIKLYKSWECFCPYCGIEVRPLATPENFDTNPLSFYALGKITQEKILGFLEKYGVQVDILRFPIVYGPGQLGKFKYAGSVGSFINKAINNQAIEILEDGYQLRDFLFVDDCVNAIINRINKIDSGDIFNIATGKKNTLLDVCNLIEKILNKDVYFKTLNTHRIGDCRHNVIDVTKSIMYMGFKPTYNLELGIKETIKRGLQNS
jgi:dTDP-L-rhamnose 4-epimerase